MAYGIVIQVYEWRGSLSPYVKSIYKDVVKVNSMTGHDTPRLTLTRAIYAIQLVLLFLNKRYLLNNYELGKIARQDCMMPIRFVWFLK